MRTRTRTAVALAALACAGCSWGLGECRGWDAKAREVLAEENAAAAGRIGALAEELRSVPASTNYAADAVERERLACEIADEAAVVRARSEDARDRALVAQDDHGYAPDEVDPGSDDDRFRFMAYAGRAQARGVRRRALRELPGRIASGTVRIVAQAAGAVVAELPWYVRWPLYAALAGALMLGLLALLAAAAVRVRRLRRAVSQYDASIERLPQEERWRIASGLDLEREHARIHNHQARDAGVLGDGGGE